MKKALAFVFGMIFVATTLAGCGTKNAFVSKTPTDFIVVASVDTAMNNAVNAVLKDEPVQGATYLTSDAPVVAAIYKVVNGYAQVRYGGDYRKMDGKEGTPYYSQDYLKKVVQQGGFQRFRDFFVNAQLVTEVSNVTVEHIVFSDNKQMAAVVWKTDTVVRSASNAWLAEAKVKPGDILSARAVTWFVLENGLWKVAQESDIQ